MSATNPADRCRAFAVADSVPSLECGPVYNEVGRQFAVDDLVKLTHRVVTIKRR
jgi:hypothetical protein